MARAFDPAVTAYRLKIAENGMRTDFGAGEGARTLDPDLGKVVLYH
jgi:hypothetical protein